MTWVRWPGQVLAEDTAGRPPRFSTRTTPPRRSTSWRSCIANRPACLLGLNVNTRSSRCGLETYRRDLTPSTDDVAIVDPGVPAACGALLRPVAGGNPA